jgi:leucine-zipper of insertion element IS481
MKEVLSSRRPITVAKRGQIIQRVIVDGWTATQVEATFGVPKRVVEVWVADFRRTGMASLRDQPNQIVLSELVWLRVSRPMRTLWRKLAIGLRRFARPEPSVEPLPLRRSSEDGPR